MLVSYLLRYNISKNIVVIVTEIGNIHYILYMTDIHKILEMSCIVGHVQHSINIKPTCVISLLFKYIFMKYFLLCIYSMSIASNSYLRNKIYIHVFRGNCEQLTAHWLVVIFLFWYIGPKIFEIDHDICIIFCIFRLHLCNPYVRPICTYIFLSFITGL